VLTFTNTGSDDAPPVTNVSLHHHAEQHRSLPPGAGPDDAEFRPTPLVAETTDGHRS
jgi:hypothetical protein